MALPATTLAAEPTITFTGQPALTLGVLSCPSTPSQDAVEITAGQTIRFINHTGKPATLWIGPDRRDVAVNASTSITFNQPTSVLAQMVPKCTLDTAGHDGLVINVDPKPAATVTPHATTKSAQVDGGQNITLNDGGSHVTIAGGQVPSAVPIAQAGVIGGGQAPVVITNNRDLIKQMVFLLGLIVAGIVVLAVMVYRRWPASRRANGGGGGRRDVPDGQATQIWDLATRIAERNTHAKFKRSRS